MGDLFYKVCWVGFFFYMLLIFWNFRGLFWIWFLVFKNFEIVFWIRITTFEESMFWKKFDLRPPYICFWFFATLRGLFSLIFGFWKFQNCNLNQNSHFLGVCFIKLFDLRPPYRRKMLDAKFVIHARRRRRTASGVI